MYIRENNLHLYQPYPEIRQVTVKDSLMRPAIDKVKQLISLTLQITHSTCALRCVLAFGFFSSGKGDSKNFFTPMRRKGVIAECELFQWLSLPFQIHLLNIKIVHQHMTLMITRLCP